MAAGDLRRVIHARSVLIKDPTDLTAGAPYGGTYLGESKLIEVRMIPVRTGIPAEEWGGLEHNSIRNAMRVIVGAVIRDRDPDALAAVFPGSSSGDSGNNLARYQATTEQGAMGADRAHGLLIAPLDDEDGEALYLPNAEPLVEEGARIAWSLDKEWGVPAVWYGLPASDADLLIEGRLEDMEGLVP